MPGIRTSILLTGLIAILSLFPAAGRATSEASPPDLSASIHVFHDARQDTAATVYIAFLGDYGLRKSNYDSLDASAREDLFRMMEYVDHRAYICMNYEFMRPGQIDFDMDLFHRLGIDAVAMTNNHTGDHPDSFYVAVQKRLQREGFTTFGQDTHPAIQLRQGGQIINILAACGNFDLPATRPLSIYDAVFPDTFQAFLGREGVHVFYAHLGGFTSFLDATDREQANRFLDAGCDAVVFGAYHATKGFIQRKDQLAVLAQGDFLFPGSPRIHEVTPTTIPILGFEAGKWVYYEIVVFDSKEGGYFRLADAALRDSTVARMERLSAMDPEQVYQAPETSAKVLKGISLLKNPANLKKLRWHHVEFLASYIMNRFGVFGVAGIGLGVGLLVGIVVRLRRGRRKLESDDSV